MIEKIITPSKLKYTNYVIQHNKFYGEYINKLIMDNAIIINSLHKYNKNKKDKNKKGGSLELLQQTNDISNYVNKLKNIYNQINEIIDNISDQIPDNDNVKLIKNQYQQINDTLNNII